MAAAPIRQWGLTPAISSALPTPADVTFNSALIEELKRQNNYESPAETAKRSVIKSVLAIVRAHTDDEASDKRHYNSSTKSPSSSSRRYAGEKAFQKHRSRNLEAKYFHMVATGLGFTVLVSRAVAVRH